MVSDSKTTAYVHQAIMLGWPRWQVDQWADAQDPPLSREAINDAYAACLEQYRLEAYQAAEVIYSLAVARREDLYRQARKDGDTQLAHKIEIDLRQLQQQYKNEQRQAAAANKADDLAAKIRARTGRAPALTFVGK